MADRKITVLNPAGYQELLQSGDSLLVDGDINLQTNRITGLPSPTLSVDAAPKSYVDSGDNANSTAITSLDSRLTNAESDITDLETDIAALSVSDASVTITGSDGITVTNGSFTLNQTGDVTISLQGPDLSGYLTKPVGDGDFIVSRSSGVTTYNDIIDLGAY